jgi:hypothetical protein
LAPAKRGVRRQKPCIRPEQFDALVELIQEPYSTRTFAAVYTGLWVSELIARLQGLLGGTEERCFEYHHSRQPEGHRTGDRGGQGWQRH